MYLSFHQNLLAAFQKMFSLLHLLILPFLCLVNALTNTTNPPIRHVYTFGPNTFIEQIAVRSNSHILLTSESVPTLFTLNPLLISPNASVLYTFPNATGLSGITEISPDVFALVSGVWDLVNTRATSLNIWTIDLCPRSPVIKHVTAIVNSTIFNGIAAIPGTDLVLAADSALGAVWRVNIRTGAYGIAFSDSLLAPLGTDPGTNLGINGIRVSANGKWVYFANSAQGFFGRVPISRCGEKVGNVEVIASVGIPTGVAGVHFDDFALDGEDKAWIATHPSDVIEVQVGKGIVADIQNSTLLLNPTSAAFGRGAERERRTLYVTNGGTFVGDTVKLVEEGVVAIDLWKV
jgi:hypothetical protein